MTPLPKPRLSVEEYLAFERQIDCFLPLAEVYEKVPLDEPLERLGASRQ